jgi:hypothetical protein
LNYKGLASITKPGHVGNTLACAGAIKQVTDVARVLKHLSVPKWELTNKVRWKQQNGELSMDDLLEVPLY